jgi:hypothetical protein
LTAWAPDRGWPANPWRLSRLSDPSVGAGLLQLAARGYVTAGGKPYVASAVQTMLE